MVPAIVWIVLLAATQVPQDHRLALCVPMASTRRPRDHRFALMSQRVSVVKTALVITLPVGLLHRSLVQLESTKPILVAIVWIALLASTQLPQDHFFVRYVMRIVRVVVAHQ